jgi:signal recognition particle subunit SRP72
MTATVQSLRTLLQHSTIEDHDQVLKASNEVLKKSKTDIQAQHSKVVALIKLDRHEDALRVFEDAGDALKEKAAVEYAYALYKCGRLKEAAEVAAKSAAGRGAKHVEAQAVCFPLPLGRDFASLGEFGLMYCYHV